MNIDDHILIQDFLQDKLSKEQKNEVLLRMEKNIDFREKVDFERQLYLNLNDNEWSVSTNHELQEVKEYEKLIKSESTQELKNTLNAINTEYQENQKKKKSLWIYSGVAMVIVLIGLTFFLSPRASSEELYANYVDLSELPSLVDRGNNDQKLLLEAQKLFEEQKYDQSLRILKKELASTQKSKATIYLYLGISQMELNQFDDAEKTFTTLINSELIDAPKGKWYKALLFIKKKNIAKAKKLLFQIAKSPENYKYKEATKLLNEL